MKRPILLGFLAIVAAMASAARAETFQPAPHGRYDLDLDTQDGNFSIWALNDLAGVDALRAKVTIRRVGSDKKWAPVFNFTLVAGTEKAIFRLQTLKPGAPTLMWLIRTSSGKEVGKELFLTFLDPSETADLLIDWTPAGQVRVRIGSKQTRAIKDYEAHDATLPGPPTALTVSSSTGELEVKPLEIGHATP